MAFPKKTDLSNLKSHVDILDIDKLKIVPSGSSNKVDKVDITKLDSLDLTKLSDVVKNGVVKKSIILILPILVIWFNNKIPKECCECICLSVILYDSVFRIGNNYYPQVFLEEFKYIIKEKLLKKN